MFLLTQGLSVHINLPSCFQIELALSVSFQTFALTMAHNKRDSAAAGLPWPGHARGHASEDADMSIPDFTNPSGSANPGETEPTVAYTSLPDVTPSFQPGTDREEVPVHQPFNYAQYGNDRTVHTITFKL